MSAATKWVAFDCPNADAADEADACGGGVEIEVAWHSCGVGRGDYAEVMMPTHCTSGCALTPAQITHYTRAAEKAAED